MSVPVLVGCRVLRDLYGQSCLSSQYISHAWPQSVITTQCMSKNSSLWNASLPSPTSHSQFFFFFFIPHILPKMVAFGHGLGCALSIYGSILSREFLSFVHCWREGGESLTSCWLDGKRPLWSSGLQVDYLKYISYPCCWHISCILSFWRVSAFSPDLGYVRSILLNYLSLASHGL